MKFRTLAVLLVVVASVPMASASVLTADEPSTAQQPAQQTENVSNADDASGAEASNYTRLYVDGERTYVDLRPGESKTMNVTVENGEDRTVSVDPRLVVPSVGDRGIDESWVSISPDGSAMLTAGAERTFAVTVDVPEGAEVGDYGGLVAFTDETVTYPGRPPRPVHAQNLGVEVWRQPTVTLEGRYGHLQVEAGEEVTHEIAVENTGDSAVPLNPQLTSERTHCAGNCPATLDRSWVDIDAPAEVGAGETATVEVTVDPAADAERGRYDFQVDLGLKDPARAERDTYWQEIDMSVEVWRQPNEPFEADFEVTGDTENVTLTLTPRPSNYRDARTGSAPQPDFDVTFVGPDGEEVSGERVRVSQSGFVDLSGDDRRSGRSDGEYAVRNGETEFVYRLETPGTGDWRVEVLPENTIGFGYEITRDES
jgi:hypothetical protein